jgi:hypothetical protein
MDKNFAVVICIRKHKETRWWQSANTWYEMCKWKFTSSLVYIIYLFMLILLVS